MMTNDNPAMFASEGSLRAFLTITDTVIIKTIKEKAMMKPKKILQMVPHQL